MELAHAHSVARRGALPMLAARHVAPSESPGTQAAITGDLPEKVDSARLRPVERYAQPHARTGRRQRGRAAVPRTRPPGASDRAGGTARFRQATWAGVGDHRWRSPGPPRRAAGERPCRATLGQRSALHARLHARRGGAGSAPRPRGWTCRPWPGRGIRRLVRAPAWQQRRTRSGARLRARARTAAADLPARPVRRLEPTPGRATRPSCAATRPGRAAGGHRNGQHRADVTIAVSRPGGAVLRTGR